MTYRCPVCAYDALTTAPVDLSICPSCGTQFGYDDVGRSHKELREARKLIERLKA